MKEEKRKRKGQTFIIDIKNTQNHTWQGTITWVQEQRQVAFRSSLELIRLLDSAIDCPAEDEPQWEDNPKED